MSFTIKKLCVRYFFAKTKNIFLACGFFGLFSLTPASAGTANYYYDAAGRLIGAFSTNTGGIGDSQWYAYDGADNRTSISSGGLSLPYQPAGIQAYTVLFQNQSITSTDGRFTLILQSDGNLALYGPSGFLWASWTNGQQAAVLINWGNGNLALYGPQFNLLWQTNTAGYPNANLVLQTDGNLVMYSSSGVAIWNSGTGGH